jgi:hypothetical protein
MEVADVKKGVLDAMARAKQRSAERRATVEASAQAYESLLSRSAVPLMRQIANVLRVENYPFTVSTPAGGVRLASDKNADDFVEIAFDTTGDAPRVVARTSWRRGRHVIDREQTIGSGAPESITEGELFAFLMKQIEPFVER